MLKKGKLAKKKENYQALKRQYEDSSRKNERFALVKEVNSL